MDNNKVIYIYGALRKAEWEDKDIEAILALCTAAEKASDREGVEALEVMGQEGADYGKYIDLPLPPREE